MSLSLPSHEWDENISEEEYRRRVLQLLETMMNMLEDIRDATTSTDQQLTGPGVRIRS